MSLASCLSTFSDDFSSETIGTISFKFHMQPPRQKGKKVDIFGLGHMMKMATRPVYGKYLKFYFCKTTVLIALKLNV